MHIVEQCLISYISAAWDPIFVLLVRIKLFSGEGLGELFCAIAYLLYDV